MREWCRRLGQAMVVVLACGVAAEAQGAAEAVPQLEIKRFVGSWFEVAWLPNKREKGCVADAITLYTVRDKAYQFAEVNSCRLKDGTIDTRNEDGKTQAKVWDGRFKIRAIWPFYAKEWVLGVGNEYEWALVGTPNHKKLWVYARARALTPETLAAVEAKAAGQGFDVSKLVLSTQPAADSRAAAAAAATPAATKPAAGGVTPP